MVDILASRDPVHERRAAVWLGSVVMSMISGGLSRLPRAEVCEILRHFLAPSLLAADPAELPELQ